MLSLKHMTLRKKTNDNGARYFPISEKTKERDIKLNRIKSGSLPRKQNKKLSQNLKNSSKT